MTPKTPFNQWLVSKLVSYLVGKEGFSTETQNFTDEGMKAIVVDTFGFRYEINVKTLSRINDDMKDSHGIAYLKTNDTLDISTIAFKLSK